MGSDNQIRNILDKINANSLFGVFSAIFQLLKTRGILTQYEVLDRQLLIPLDGTEYFSSQNIHCEQCSHRTHKNGTVTYFHSAILPVIVSPQQKAVISLDPEFITPQDGHEKQDCEVAAAKRWLNRHREFFDPFSVTLLGDDLYSRQPMCQEALQNHFHYLFVCLPESHSTLYEFLDYADRVGEVYSFHERRRHGRDWHDYHYRWTHHLPLKDDAAALSTHWFEVTVSRRSDGQVLFHNAWITDHFPQADNIVELASVARSRWKTENENHNTLKTQGYHLEHNFGHGDQHLATFLLTLNLLAFLFHTVLQLLDDSYQRIRLLLGTRRRFFHDLRTLTTYFVFDSWQHLFDFMLESFDPLPSANSS
ncbi:MAG: ISNCY family transposase [Snowella sp.]|nr:ISNCY family transposase [Snowella sp.]